MAAHMHSAPVPPMQLDGRIPQALNDVVLMGLAKDAGGRFQSAGAFRSALAQSLQAPAPVAPAPVAAPQPGYGQPQAPYSPPVPPVQQGSSARTMYMLAGSLATVVVAAVLVTQAPKFFRTSAQQPPLTEPVKTEPAQVPVTVPEVKQAEQPPAHVEPVPHTTVPAPAAGGPKTPSAPAQPYASQPASAPPAYTAPVSTPQAPVSQPQAPVQAPMKEAAPTVDRAALDGQRKRMVQMSQRIVTAKAALQSLRESMAAQGLRPRAELQGASQRMQFEMDQAEASLNASDPAQARQHLDYAERALETLEKALNL
jgi:hypothetical protein